MFTFVNSTSQKVQQTIKSGAETNFANDASSQNEINFSFITQLKSFFSVKNDYLLLQLVIFSITLIVSIFFSIASCFLISASFGLSLFVGSIAGIFYLRLLAKSIGNLGKSSSGVSKIQLLLPVCLFIFASKNELIEILPSIIGFFLYKPALIFYFSRS